MKQIKALVLTLLGIAKFNVVDGKVIWSASEKKKLQENLEEATFKQLEAAFEKDIQTDAKVVTAAKEIEELLKTMNLSPEEAAEKARTDTSSDDDDTDEANLSAVEKRFNTNMKELTNKINAKNVLIEKLINASEDDLPIERIKGAKFQEAMKHSKTHLFGSDMAYDAFEGRGWNQRAAGLTTMATDFSDQSTIQKLNGDISLFYRENPTSLESLHRDNFELPSQWDKLTNIVDRITHATIATAEITQARKLPWLKKNRQAIKAEEGRVFPISIDAEFIGHLMSNIETSWLNGFNKEGSQAYKISFARFLVLEIDKQARTEDRIASIKAVYSATPDDATVPGKFIHRQDGLLYLLWKARDIDQKYRAFDIGVPTTSNIVDYVDNLIKALPIEVREKQGLELDLSQYWLKAYRKRFRALHGLETDFKGEPEHPKDYPNIIFQPLVDLEGHDIMFITFSKNIQILENLPKEKSMYKFEYFLRVIYVLADYKMGIRFKHIGAKVVDSDPDQFKVQTVWSNSVPIFMPDFYVPVHDDTTGIIDATFDRLQVADDWKTNVTKLENTTPGTIIRLQGNENLAATKNVTTGADITLVGGTAYDLQLGGTITFLVKPDGSLQELTRTIAPAAIIIEQAVYDDATVDADLGSEFASEHAATTAITSIVNGVENKVIKLYGTDTGAVNVTIAAAVGNIALTGGAATLATSNDFIELILVGGVWYEVSRTIA